MKISILCRAAAAALLCALPMLAQVPVGYVQVTGSTLTDSSGVPVANATIAFAPVNNSGTAIGYQVNGKGQAITSPVTTLVTAGAFSIRLADTTLTAPVNVCFSVTATDNTSGKSYLGPGYTCFQPAGYGAAVSSGMCTAASGSAGGTCNFDNFQPNLPGLVVQQTGPAGPAGPAGAAGAPGAPGGSLSYPGVTSNGANGLAITGTPTNPTDAATVAFVKTQAPPAGPGIVKTSERTSNATISYNAAPRIGYQMPALNGFYYPALTIANLPNATNLSNVTVTYQDSGGATIGTATGVGATTAGVAGTAFLPLPQPLDITQPTRLNVHICIGSNTSSADTNQLKVGFTNSAGSSSFGFIATSSQSLITSFFLGGTFLNSYGFTGGIPSFTCGSFFMDWIGNGAGGLDASGAERAWTGWIPDSPDILRAIANPAFQTAYVNSPWETEAAITPSSLASVTGLYISDASVNSIITGVYVSQGRLDGPTDGLMPVPGFISPVVLDDASLARTYPSEVWIPKTYGVPVGTPMVSAFHQNGFYFSSGAPQTGALTGGGAPANLYANLFNSGYIIAGLTGAAGVGRNNAITGCGAGTTVTCGPTSTDWGSNTGNQYRYALAGLVRQFLPGTNQLFRFCMSMGCLDALGDEMRHPGGAGIAMFSPALNLTAAYTLSGAAPFGSYTNFATNINEAYGTWYQSLQATNTGNTPASSPTFWQPVVSGINGLSLGHMSPARFTNNGAYFASTAYVQNALVEVAYTGAIGALAPFDPNLHSGAFTSIPIQSWTEGQDSIVPTAWSSTFIASVTAAGNGTATNNQLSDCTASGGNTCHLTTGVFNPALTATLWNTTSNKSPVLSFFETYRTPFPSALGSAQLVASVGGGSQPHNYATITKTANATSATPSAPCTAFRCRVVLVGGTATTGNIFTMVWPTGTFASVPLCNAVESGGTSLHNVSSSGESLTGTNINAGVTVSGATLTVDVTCVQP